MFGKSFVYVIFEDGTDIYWARSRVIEYLNAVRGMLPEGVNPVIGPDATGVGWVSNTRSWIRVANTTWQSCAHFRIGIFAMRLSPSKAFPRSPRWAVL